VKCTDLVLGTASIHLVREQLGAGLFGFGFVDVFHKDPLVLEHVALGFLIEFVVPASYSSAPNLYTNPKSGH